MDYETILYDIEDHVARIQLNRPDRLNALSNQLISEMNDALERVRQDPEVGVLIITGSEKSFAAGADIKEIQYLQNAVDAYHFVAVAQEMFNRIDFLDKPVIAAVCGLALGGGCELALACDIRLAADTARFGLPEIKIGLLPGGGGTQRLPRLIGAGLAKELLFMGEPIDAAEAYRIGLVNKVVSPGDLLPTAQRMAATLLQRPPHALKMIKHAVNEGLNMDLRAGLAHERRCFEILFTTKDKSEGLSAFIEKRKPQFSGQ